MKKILVFVTAFMLLFSSFAYAAGGKNHGSKGKGNTGGTGKGAVTQNSR
ncbi:hypothetical protein ACFL4N_04820 [Thermodesulfobacteriota bacterium]